MPQSYCEYIKNINPTIKHGLISVVGRVAMHPKMYVGTLIQLGYKPFPLEAKKMLFSNKIVQVYPSSFKYFGHIFKEDGIIGLYNGLLPSIIEVLVDLFVRHELEKNKIKNESDVKDVSEILYPAFWNNLPGRAKKIIKECFTVTVSTIISYPFNCIMVRMMASFVGKETSYNSIFSAASQIYKVGGFSEFYKGFFPKLTYTLLLAISGHMLFDLFELNKTLKFIACEKINSEWCSKIAMKPLTILAYPLLTVSNVMIINNTKFSTNFGIINNPNFYH
ncbi:Mitochondrial carrier [Intoshia linei]|uniref:Mitochondrial carrier n=1 Tax=Intoshia linei TaxID=1819745 RepID=A0A177B483_9BILA|nr:Mitochondrial carrier [Intoshia linei]